MVISYKKISLYLLTLAAFALIMSSCAPYQAHKGTFYHKQRGKASWYGPGFAGRKTANGESFNPSQLTAAHKTLPFNTTVRVTNLENGESVNVRINDRGPYAGRRIIDLSKAAAKKIGLIQHGVAMVEIETVSPGNPGKVQTAKAPDVAPKAAPMMLASSGIRKNGVEHLISVENAKDAPVPDEIDEPGVEDEAEEEMEVASVPKGVADDRISSIEERFVVTASVSTKKPSRKTPKTPPVEKPLKSAPSKPPAAKPQSVDDEEF